MKRKIAIYHIKAMNFDDTMTEWVKVNRYKG